MNEQKRDALTEAVSAHVYEVASSGSALCTCGWPESRRGIDTDLQTAHRSHIADTLMPLVDIWLAEAEQRGRDETRATVLHLLDRHEQQNPMGREQWNADIRAALTEETR